MEYSLFGCKVNKYYLNQWLNYFEMWGKDMTNAHLIATCVVTDRAKSKWIKHAIGYLEEGKKVYLTGCGAFEKGNSIDYEAFFKIYPKLGNWQWKLILLWESPDIKDWTDKKSSLKDKNMYTRKFIVIQNGCDTYCTFCLTISKRGAHRTRWLKSIIEEVKSFEAQWWKEIILTGVNLAAWWASHTRKPKETKFSELLENIIEKTNIERIRISSLWPEFLDENFFELMKNPRFLPHFHFSIQHFDDTILQSMNRAYDSKQLDYVLREIRNLDRPDRDYISIGADIIVGFPGETEAMFQILLDKMKQYTITKLHAFPFSSHEKWESVPAWKFPYQVAITTKKKRMKQLLSLWDEIRSEFIQQNKQKKRPILLESQEIIDGVALWTGRTPNYIQRTVTWSYKRGDIIIQ